jgi:hypothetical protein
LHTIKSSKYCRNDKKIRRKLKMDMSEEYIKMIQDKVKADLKTIAKGEFLNE